MRLPLRLTLLAGGVCVVSALTCPTADGFYRKGDYCYRSLGLAFQFQFDTANSTCWSLPPGGSHPPVIPDSTVNTDASSSRFSGAGSTGYGGNNGWVFLKRDSGSSSFKWQDGSNSTYRNWAPGSPTKGTSERCVITNYKTAGKWKDVACTDNHFTVCQMDESDLIKPTVAPTTTAAPNTTVAPTTTAAPKTTGSR